MPMKSLAARTSKSAAPVDRGARRREQTRARLVQAAREVMARKGIGATSIQEITDTADVGFGSFYNHFASKEAIADAVMEDAIEGFGDAAERMAARIDDPAEVLAASIRHAVQQASADEAWGWFLVRTGLTRADGFKTGLGRRMARDIQVGIDAKRFTVADSMASTLGAGGVVLALIAACLRGAIVKDAPERTATVVLKMLGLSDRDAVAVARRPLPPINAEVQRPAAPQRSTRRR